MHSGLPTPPKPIGLSTSIGIASLILEGRSQCDDEDAGDSAHDPPSNLAAGRQSVGNNQEPPFLSNVATTSYGHDVKSLVNSQSSAAAHSADSSKPGCSRTLNSSVADDTVQHIQRLRQKLMLIRSAPGTSHDAVKHAIAVSSGSTSYCASSDDELDTVFQTPTQQPLKREGNLLSTLRSLATNTCLNTTPRSFGRTQGLLSTVEAWTPAGFMSRCSDVSKPTICPSAVTPSPPLSQEKKLAIPNVGPHCEEFMKKIGLIKSAKAASMTAATTTPIRTKSTPDEVYVEEHTCYESKMNVCLRLIYELNFY